MIGSSSAESRLPLRSATCSERAQLASGSTLVSPLPRSSTTRAEAASLAVVPSRSVSSSRQPRSSRTSGIAQCKTDTAQEENREQRRSGLRAEKPCLLRVCVYWPLLPLAGR